MEQSAFRNRHKPIGRLWWRRGGYKERLLPVRLCEGRATSRRVLAQQAGSCKKARVSTGFSNASDGHCGGLARAFAPTMLHLTEAQTLQLQPLVPPQVLHFMQVPLRTSV